MRRYRLAVSVPLTLAATACYPFGTSEVRYDPVSCLAVQPILAESAIDSTGGTLLIGPHRLEVPENAVTQPVSFSGTLSADEYLILDLRANEAERFAFEVPATLWLSYAACEVQPDEVENLRIYRVDPALQRGIQMFEVELSRDEEGISAELPTLSVYTIGRP